jgi:hypothetical protein
MADRSKDLLQAIEDYFGKDMATVFGHKY